MATKKIRIAVAITPSGEWNCCGWGGGGKEPSDKEKMNFAFEPLPDGESHFWVEAEIPIPEETIINGIVREG